MAKLTLAELVEKVEDIPSFPETVIQLLKILEDPLVAISDVENTIMKDQGLTAKVLKLANSAFYGSRSPISTVKDATVRLGFQAVKSMVLTSAVAKVMNQPLDGYSLEAEALWRQSQACAIVARVVAKRIKYPKPDEAYTAGLLRDMGKVILDTYMKDEFLEVLRLVQEDQKTFIEAEALVIGFDHGQIGARIGQKWKLSRGLIEAIESHHQPNLESEHAKLVAIVHLADSVIMMLGLNLGVDGLMYNFIHEAMDLLGLDQDDLMEIMSDVATLLEDEGIYV